MSAALLIARDSWEQASPVYHLHVALLVWLREESHTPLP